MTNSSIDLTLADSDFGVEELPEGNALGCAFSHASASCPASAASPPPRAGAARAWGRPCAARGSTTPGGRPLGGGWGPGGPSPPLAVPRSPENRPEGAKSPR